ncbi:MAG TPA: sigma-70 family RNA polymerase sigma factor [Candidatus Acidoferrales bacterium]|nr:sigma-70 family RNA polymerase sigma factor [Candidatus Acidoferrales bacterium]
MVERYVADPSLANRNALVAAHHYLCRRGARKFYRGTIDRADLEQVGAIGLIKAAQRYSGAYQTPFEAYAWLVIVGELMHFVRDHERLVRTPRQLRALERRFAQAYEELSARSEREPTTSALAAEIGVSALVIDQLRALRGSGNRSENQDDETRNLRDDAIFTQAEAQTEAYSLEDRLSLTHALRTLSGRELRIVREIFFMERTQSEVGRGLGISQRQVSRLLTRTLQRLARMLDAA